MTANQISYAVAQETKRHNEATEDIEREKNRLQSIRNDNDRIYQERSNDIQERYNNVYLELQQTQGDKRLELEEELNSIKREQNAIDQWYKTESVALKASEVDVARQDMLNTDKYRTRLNDLGYEKNQIDWYDAMVREKWNEYQAHSIELTHAEQNLALQTAILREQHDFEINLLNVQNKANEINLNAQATLLEAKTKLRGQDMGLLETAVNAASNLVNTTANVSSKFYK